MHSTFLVAVPLSVGVRPIRPLYRPGPHAEARVGGFPPPILGREGNQGMAPLNAVRLLLRCRPWELVDHAQRILRKKASPGLVFGSVASLELIFAILALFMGRPRPPEGHCSARVWSHCPKQHHQHHQLPFVNQS